MVLSEDKSADLSFVYTGLRTRTIPLCGAPVSKFDSGFCGALRGAVPFGDSLSCLQLLPSVFISAFLMKRSALWERDLSVTI